MDKNSPIGFFDSGVGGLSVYAKFRSLLKNENTIYYGDLKNLPYGNKSQEDLIKFARNILNFFASKDVKAVVIACNTSSALAYETVKNEYNFKIYPIIQSCAKIIASLNISRIGIFATSATVKSGAYNKEITKYNPNTKVKEIACPNWVNIVEKTTSINAKDDIKERLNEMLEFNPDKIVLGCTHFPYLMEELSKYVPKDKFIDPAGIFSVYIKEDLSKLDLLTDSNITGNEEFFVSASPEAFLQNSKLFYDIKTLPHISSEAELLLS